MQHTQCVCTVHTVRTMKRLSAHKGTCSNHCAFNSTERPILLKAIHETTFPCEILRSALFWVVTQRVVAVPYRRFGTTYRSHLQGIPKNGTDRSERIGYYWTPFCAAQNSRRAQIAFPSRLKPEIMHSCDILTTKNAFVKSQYNAMVCAICSPVLCCRDCEC